MWLAETGWCGPSSWCCDLFRVDESRQYATDRSEGSLHAGPAASVGFFVGVEWPVWRTDILCDLRISDHIDYVAAMGFLVCGELA